MTSRFTPRSEGSRERLPAGIVENPEKEISVAIMDGVGRQVAQGMIDPADSSVITWSTVAYDNEVSIAGFSDGAGGTTNGTVVETAAVLPIKDLATGTNDLRIVRRADGGGRVLDSIDQEGQRSAFRFDGNSNRTSFLDPNGVGHQECEFDPINREIWCTDTEVWIQRGSCQRCFVNTTERWPHNPR